MSNKKSKLPERDRWISRPVFVLACVGSSIGLGNIWKFPYMTAKHGGWQFIVAYIIALFIIATPMLILELTLGQKMQKGSVGAIRGITPKLAGVGWVASYVGLIISTFYNIMMGLTAIYFIGGIKASGETGAPWDFKNKMKPSVCKQAELMGMKSEEIYLY